MDTSFNGALPESIVSSKGRAMSMALRNLPPDQQQAYINQQIMAGNIDYLSALALKGQYDRLKNSQQQQQPPNTTIVGGMQAALATGNPNAAPIPAPNSLLSPSQGIAQPPQPSQGGPQGGPQGGMAQGIAQPMPQQPQPQGGIPSVPVPALDDADYSMARGGIVAFAGGQSVPRPTADFYVDAEGNIRQGVRGGAMTPAEALPEMLTEEQLAKGVADIGKTTPSRWTKGLPIPESWQNVLNRPVGGLGSLPTAGEVGSAAADLYLPALGAKTLWEGAGSYRDLYKKARGEEVNPEYDADAARRMFGMKDSNDANYDAISQSDYGNHFFTDPQFWRDYGMNLAGTAADIFSLGMFEPKMEEPPAAPKKEEKKEEFAVAPALPPGIGGPEKTGVGFSLPPVNDARIRAAYNPIAEFFKNQEAEAKGRVGTEDTHAAEYAKRLADRGIGATSKKRQAEITNELADMPSERRRAAWLNAAAGFFEAAGETAQGKSLGASWATGAATGLKGYRADVKELKVREDRLRDAQANLQMADEAVQMGILNKGDVDYKAAKAEWLAAKQGVAQTEASANTAVISAHQEREKELVQLIGAQIAASKDNSTPLEKAMRPWYDAYNYYQQHGDIIKAEQAYRQLKQLAQTDPRIMAILAGVPQVPAKPGSGGKVEVVGVRPEGK